MSFTEHKFEKRLLELKDSQESIQTLSAWCLQQRQYHKKIIATWLRILKKVKVEQRLSLFYLANDVIQYSKRKNYEFVSSWNVALQKATPLVRDEKVKHKILRIFQIWSDRAVYDDAFLTDLCGLLTAPAKRKYPEVEFQVTQAIRKIRNCSSLEKDTDIKFKALTEKPTVMMDIDTLQTTLKERAHGDDAVQEIDEGLSCMQSFLLALEREIKERAFLIDVLEQAEGFYENQNGEARIVWNAYRNFGSRVKQLKRRLDEIIPQLPQPSPVPSPPDIDAPSPSADEDIDLPGSGEETEPQFVENAEPVTTTTTNTTDVMDTTSFTSFMNSGSLPFDIQRSLFNDNSSSVLPKSPSSVQVADEQQAATEATIYDPFHSEGKPIEVISSRTKSEETFNISDFFKTLNTIPLLGTEIPESSSLSSTDRGSYTPSSNPVNTSDSSYQYTPPLPSALLQPPPLPPDIFPVEPAIQYTSAKSPVTYKSVDSSTPYDPLITSTPYKSVEHPVPFKVVEPPLPYEAVEPSARYKTSVEPHTPYQTGEPQESYKSLESEMYKSSGSHAPYNTTKSQNIYETEEHQPVYKTSSHQNLYKMPNHQTSYKNQDQVSYSTSLHQSSYKTSDHQDSYKTPDHQTSYKTSDHHSAYKISEIQNTERLSPYRAAESVMPYKYSESPEIQNSWNTKLPPKFPTWGDAESDWNESDKCSEWMPAMPIAKIIPPRVIETPESPPTYEKESFSDPVEYDDSVSGDTLLETSATDVDHRTLVPLPLANNVETFNCQPGDHAKDVDHRTLLHVSNTNLPPHDTDHRTLGIRKKDVDHRTLPLRKQDVDHRNLISLTGSPLRDVQTPLAPPPTPPSSMWLHGDQDYRVTSSHKSDDKNDKRWNMDQDYRFVPPRNRKSSEESQDNVESVDMELSDEEGFDQHLGSDISHSRKAANSDRSFNGNQSTKSGINKSVSDFIPDHSSKFNNEASFQKIPTIGVDIKPLRQRNPQMSASAPVRNFVGVTNSPRSFVLSPHSARGFRSGPMSATLPMAPPPMPPMLPGDTEKFRTPSPLFRPAFSPRQPHIQNRSLGFFHARPMILSPRQMTPVSSGRDLMYNQPTSPVNMRSFLPQSSPTSTNTVEYFHGKPIRSHSSSSRIHLSESVAGHGRSFVRSLSTPQLVEIPESCSVPEEPPLSASSESHGNTVSEFVSMETSTKSSPANISSPSPTNVPVSPPHVRADDLPQSSTPPLNESAPIPEEEKSSQEFPEASDTEILDTEFSQTEMLDTEFSQTEMSEVLQDKFTHPPTVEVSDTEIQQFDTELEEYLSSDMHVDSDNEESDLLEKEVVGDSDQNLDTHVDELESENEFSELADSVAVESDINDVPLHPADEDEVKESDKPTSPSISEEPVSAESSIANRKHKVFISSFLNEKVDWMNDDLPESHMFPDGEQDEHGKQPSFMSENSSYDEGRDKVRFHISNFRGRGRGRGRGQGQPFINSIRGNFSNSIRGNFNNSIHGNFSNSMRGNYNSMRGDFSNSMRGDFSNSMRGDLNNSARGNFNSRTRPNRGWIGPKRGWTPGPPPGPPPPPPKNIQISPMSNPRMRFQFQQTPPPNAPPPLLSIPRANFMRGNRGQLRPFRGNNQNRFGRW